jgi:hypothetical protein
MVKAKQLPLLEQLDMVNWLNEPAAGEQRITVKNSGAMVSGHM